jgi:hypothetical protein
MGLDMFLTAKRYVWKHLDEEQSLQGELNKVMEEELCSTDMRVSEVSVNAFYWRKANAIHKWFVDNCQGGEDNCREYWVDAKQLVRLKDICESVLNTKDVGLLPSEGGFFFGSTDYDEWYFKDLQDTVDGLEKVLKLDTSKWDFYYRASW